MTGFPPDLPGLLRIAAGTGKLRLHVWYGSKDGVGRFQANLANSGDGWTVEHGSDALEAIAAVLRIRFGKMLERQRAGDPAAAEAVHPAHRSAPVQLDIEDAIAGLIG